MKYKGFTLIEVLIVVIIIGILATLLMPQLTSMSERARTAEAKNIMGAVRTALYIHHVETTNWPTATDIANTAAFVGIIGNVFGPSDKGLFEYGLDCDAVDAASVTIFAERNTNKGGGDLTSHTKLRMLVNDDGSADAIETKFTGGAGKSVGANITLTW